MIYINTLYTKNFYESIYSIQQIKELIKNKKITDFYNITKFKNINQEIIDKYKNKSWDWEWLIQNTNIYVEKYISFHLIKKYSYKWNYFKLSKNQNLTEEFILKYPNQNWDIKYLIKKNKIINFNALTKFKKIDEDTIYSYPDKPWDWEWLIENTKLNKSCYNTLYTKNFHEDIYASQQLKKLIKNTKTTDFYNITKFKYIDQEIIDKYKNKPWDWEWLIENTDFKIEKYIPLNLIKKYSYKWDYFKLNYNPNLTEEFILKYPNQNWNIKYLIKKNKITNFNALTKFKKIDEYTIYSYSDKPWDWEWLIENTKLNRLYYIPYNLIKKYPYNWDFSSNCYRLTEKFILKYPYQNWDIDYLIRRNKITDFKALSKFKKINQYIIDKYPNEPWDWEWLIENTNIDVEKHIPSNIIEKYSYKWNYNKLKKNKNFIRKTQEKIFYKIKN